MNIRTIDQGREIMISAQIARLIANQLIFLEFCDDEICDPDSALKVMEYFLADVEAIDKDFLRQIVDAFPIISAEYKNEMIDFVTDIPETYDLNRIFEASDDEPQNGVIEE